MTGAFPSFILSLIYLRMAMKIKSLEIYRSETISTDPGVIKETGDLVGHSCPDYPNPRTRKIVVGEFEIDCYLIPKLILHRIVTIQILNGSALGGFINNSTVILNNSDVLFPVYYVMGTVETFKGSNSITKVVVANPPEGLQYKNFALRLPEIYRKFVGEIR